MQIQQAHNVETTSIQDIESTLNQRQESESTLNQRCVFTGELRTFAFSYMSSIYI